MARYRHLFHRSEYQIALHNYRRARRRGDAAEAQRWIRIADMHLRVADRFDDRVHTNGIREADLAKARAAPEAPAQEETDHFAVRRKLDELARRMDADIAAGWRPGRLITSPAEGSASAGET